MLVDVFRPVARSVALGVVAVALLLDTAHAQFPGVTQDVTARGRVDYTDAVGGPADVYVGWIRMDPGSTYGGWHTHPGPVWVALTAGELAVYGPDACRTLYLAGDAYIAEANTLYDLRNESSEPVELWFAGIIPAGQPPTVLGDGPQETCAD